LHIPIIPRLSARYVSRGFLQSILCIIGVALGVGVVVAIDLANASASRAFALSTQTISGRATHQIIGGTGGLPSEVYRALRTELGLTELAPLIQDTVRSPELGDRPLRLLGVDPFAEPPFRDYLTTVEVEGGAQSSFDALTAFIVQPNTVLISATTAQRYGIRPGDTIALQPGGQPAQVQVVGVLLTDDETSRQALDDLILTDIATAQEIVGEPGVISRIDLILPGDYDTAQIESLLPPDAVLTTPAAQNSVISQLTDAFELNLQALSLLALVVGVFLIYNTIAFSVVRRRGVLGILRALGATKAQLFRMIAGEALFLGAVGTLIGLGLGIIFGRASVGLIAQTISDLYFTVNVQGVSLDPFTLIKGITIGLAASLIAALIPAIDATRTPPAGSLRRSQLEETTRRLLPLITFGAAALCLLGVILLSLPSLSLLFSFGGLFCIVVGGALFTPAVMLLFMRGAAPAGGRIFGVLGKMAPRAVSRSLSRTSVAVAALTVAVSVIVGVSLMIASFRGTVTDWLNTTLGADIYISPPQLTAVRAEGNVERALADLIAAVDGVERVVSGRNVSATAPDYPDLPPVSLIVADGEVTQGRREFAWITVPRERYWQALNEGDVVMVSEPFANRRGITPENNQITLLTERGEVTFTVEGVFYDYTSDQGVVFMADNTYRRYFNDPYISTMAVFLEEGANYQTTLDGIRTALSGTDLTAQSNRSLRDGALEIFERTFSITQALRLLAIIVAFIGILSALMALQIEQTRQYGTMRAVGLTRRQLWNFTLLQTGLMGAVAGVLALPIGAALAAVLIYVINVRSFGWTMRLTLLPGEFLFAFAIAIIAALLAGVYPAARISRLAAAAALRGE
jgi:putative ABC transport system permease protein